MGAQPETLMALRAVRETGKINMFDRPGAIRLISQIIEFTDDPDGEWQIAMDELSDMTSGEYVAALHAMSD